MAPLLKHIAYLKREGVTREGKNARMFDSATDTADERVFAKRCENDYHNLRLSPEEATQMDLHTFTRELMTNAEIDLAKAGLDRFRSLEYRQRTSMSWCAGVPMAGETRSSAAITSAMA